MQVTKREWKHDLRQMTHLAWPALCENLLATLVQFIDTAMVGVLGAAATAAVAVNTTPMWLLNGIVQSVGVGGTALIARMIGAQDREGAEGACRQVFLASFLLSIVIFAIVMIIAPYIPVWLRADASLHQDATAYIRLIALGFIPHFTGMALGAAMRGSGDTKTPMLVALGANILNVIGNFLLIFEPRTISVFGQSFHMWGAGMGVAGAAISTAFSTGLAGVFMFILIMRPKGSIRLRLARLRPDGELLRRIFRVGIPTAAERVTINVGQLIFVSLIASLGTAQLAAHHLSITVESLSYMPGFAFGVAATTLVGQSLGANDIPGAKSRGGMSIIASVIVMSVIGVLMYLFAPQLIGMLTPDLAVREIGARLIRICAIEQPFMALSMVGASALRGAGDTRVPLYASLAGMWGIRLLLARFLALTLGLGVDGAWYAMVVDIALRGIWMGIRFARGRWVAARV